MATILRVHQLEDLAHSESPSEVLIDTYLNTELHITAKGGITRIRLPYGNDFEVIDGCIIIHDKE